MYYGNMKVLENQTFVCVYVFCDAKQLHTGHEATVNLKDDL